jgi:hypothetical protein
VTKSKTDKNASEERETLYPEIRTLIGMGDDALTEEDCKKLLGWEAEEGDVKFGTDYLLIDEQGKKVRCLNNKHNRPLYSGVVKNLIQEHLNKRWVFNGEPIIIGKTGQVLNGQHTLVSLVLANQIRMGESKALWDDIWGEEAEIKLEKLVVFGIDESDNTVNTMDLAKPRSLADVIYRSELFSSMGEKDRKTVSRITDNAIRFLWYRMGVGTDPFAPRRTHSEALDFVQRHPQVLAAVKHIFQEESEKSISKYVNLGTAAALLYLMGTHKTDGNHYRHQNKKDESLVDMEAWDEACSFWVALSKGGEDFKEVRYAIGNLADSETGVGGSNAEKIAIIIKAWCLFYKAKKITMPGLALEYYTDDEGTRHIINHPDLGGLDLGDPKGQEKSKKIDPESSKDDHDPPAEEGGDEDDDSAEEAKSAADYAASPGDPSPDEIESAKVAERKRRAKEISEELKARKAKEKEKAKKEPSDDDEDSESTEPSPISDFKPIKPIVRKVIRKPS